MINLLLCISLKYWVSIAQIIGVLVAIFALIWQIRRSWFLSNIEINLKLEDKFNRPDLKDMRHKAAKCMLDGQFSEAEDVFDFFETIGHLVRRKKLDKEFVWHTFYEWIHGYWSSGVEYITETRKREEDQTLWEDFEWLHNELLKIQKHKGGISRPLLSKEEIKKFLENEL